MISSPVIPPSSSHTVAPPATPTPALLATVGCVACQSRRDTMHHNCASGTWVRGSHLPGHSTGWSNTTGEVPVKDFTETIAQLATFNYLHALRLNGVTLCSWKRPVLEVNREDKTAIHTYLLHLMWVWKTNHLLLCYFVHNHGSSPFQQSEDDLVCHSRSCKHNNNVSRAVRKTIDYNRHSSNNVLACLPCADETGIKLNPICFQSRFSVSLSTPTPAWKEKGNSIKSEVRSEKGAGWGGDADV